MAAILDDPAAFEPPVVVVLSGGNIDPLLLMRVLRHGLAVAGRFLSFRARIPDRPGALVSLLAEVAAADASVLEVEHVRTDPRLRVDEVEVAAAAGDPRCRALRRGAGAAARGRLHVGVLRSGCRAV